MKIRMLNTERGSVDGICVSLYEVGREYDLSRTVGERDLAAAFIGAELAEPADSAPEREPVQESVVANAVTETTAPAPARRAPRAKK